MIPRSAQKQTTRTCVPWDYEKPSSILLRKWTTRGCWIRLNILLKVSVRNWAEFLNGPREHGASSSSISSGLNKYTKEVIVPLFHISSASMFHP